MKKGSTLLIIVLIIVLMGLTSFITLLLTGTINLSIKEDNSQIKEATKDKNNGETTINENMFNITYKEEVYSGTTKEGNEVKNLRNIPIVTSIERKDAAEKITNYLTKKSDENWKEIKEMTDQVVDGNLPYQDMGVTLKYNTEVINNNRLSLVLTRTGNFGGVGWEDESGYNFDATTGELLTLESIGSGVYDIVKEECLNYLKTSDQSLYSDINIDEWLDKEGIWYFDFNHLIVVFPKYSLSSRIIKIPISKSKINDALKDKYKF